MATMCNLLREKFSRTEMTVELDVESLEYYIAEHLKGMGEQESAYFQMIVGDILSMTQKRPEYNPDFWKSGLPKENGKYLVAIDNEDFGAYETVSYFYDGKFIDDNVVAWANMPEWRKPE